MVYAYNISRNYMHGCMGAWACGSMGLRQGAWACGCIGACKRTPQRTCVKVLLTRSTCSLSREFPAAAGTGRASLAMSMAFMSLLRLHHREHGGREGLGWILRGWGRRRGLAAKGVRASG
jgi:hypothetical protein